MKSTILSLAVLSAVLGATTQDVNINGIPAVITSGDTSGPKVAAITCAEGQYLTYAIETSPFNGTTLAEAQSVLSNWTYAAPGEIVTVTGSSEVGAIRTWNITDSSIGEISLNVEMLKEVTEPTSGNSNLEQRWTQSQAEYANDLTIYDGHHDLTVQGNSAGELSLQYFINACCSSQVECNIVLPKILQYSIGQWIADIQA